MKLSLILVLILLVAFIVYIFWRRSHSTDQPLWDNYRTKKITIEDHSYNVIIAANPLQWSKGLMFVQEKDPAYDGMIFQFGFPSPLIFWNKNTFVDLDIYWMRKGKVIGKSQLPSIEHTSTIVSVSAPSLADTAIEIIKEALD